VKVAGKWRDGLAGWGIGHDHLAAFKKNVDVTVYSPGSQAGHPLNLLGSLKAPSLSWETDEEQLREEIEGFVAGLLGLVDIESDPLSSREHILLSNLVEHAWRNGRDLDLAQLLVDIQNPPLKKLGVFDLDVFFPQKDRLALAMKLNGLAASPSFSAWMSGTDLDVGAMLDSKNGRTPASIFYLNHLSEPERQFFVTLLLSRVASWMRSQSGTSGLRALVYMDEVYGYAPPTAQPPSKKPILTLLKQARAFGVGLVLSTQNPVDLDYKAMSNAGTWMVGRLQTDRDKARILEGLRSVRGDVAGSMLDDLITGLGKRQFLLHQTRRDQPALFSTRWAMSYLRGPLTKDELGRLKGDMPPPSRSPTASPSTSPSPEPTAQAPAPSDVGESLPDDVTPVQPQVAEGVRVQFLSPAAEWARDVGAGQGPLEAALVATVQLRFDERRARMDHAEVWEAVFHPLGAHFDGAGGKEVDHDPRDFALEAPPEARYRISDAPLDKKSFFNDAKSRIKTHLLSEEEVEIHFNPQLKLYGRVGESRDAFAARCEAVADAKADEEAVKVRDKAERKMKTLTDRMRRAEDRLTDAEAALAAQKQNEVISGAGALLSVFLGGKTSTRGIISRAARKAGGAARRRGQSQRGAQRVETAREKIANIQEDLQELEYEILEDVEAIREKWEEKATAVESMKVGLEKSDIEVRELSLLWMPVG
jgi:hypothetical protein